MKKILLVGMLLISNVCSANPEPPVIFFANHSSQEMDIYLNGVRQGPTASGVYGSFPYFAIANQCKGKENDCPIGVITQASYDGEVTIDTIHIKLDPKTQTTTFLSDSPDSSPEPYLHVKIKWPHFTLEEG